MVRAFVDNTHMFWGVIDAHATFRRSNAPPAMRCRRQIGCRIESVVRVLVCLVRVEGGTDSSASIPASHCSQSLRESMLWHYDFNTCCNTAYV